jgi:hypothetical protein
LFSADSTGKIPFALCGRCVIEWGNAEFGNGRKTFNLVYNWLLAAGVGKNIKGLVCPKQKGFSLVSVAHQEFVSFVTTAGSKCLVFGDLGCHDLQVSAGRALDK